MMTMNFFITYGMLNKAIAMCQYIALNIKIDFIFQTATMFRANPEPTYYFHRFTVKRDRVDIESMV